MDAISLIERIASLAKTINNIEVIELTNELRLEIATIKGTLADTVIENQRLKAQLQKAATSVSEMTFRDGLYWKGDDGPFCTACHDTKKASIRVTLMPFVFAQMGKYSCPVCSAHYC